MNRQGEEVLHLAVTMKQHSLGPHLQLQVAGNTCVRNSYWLKNILRSSKIIHFCNSYGFNDEYFKRITGVTCGFHKPNMDNCI